MGAEKKIGIDKEMRRLAERYASRYNFSSYHLILSRRTRRREIYFIGVDYNDIVYRIRYVQVRKMRKPKGVQVLNKKDYFVMQANLVHGENTYDYSLINDKDITFTNKLSIICREHGIFLKRKSAHVTDRMGCPKCSAKRVERRRRYVQGS